MADEISREALLIYLDDIRTMETIVYESENALAQAQDGVVQENYEQKNIGRVNQVKQEEAKLKEPEKPNMPSIDKVSPYVSLFYILAGCALLGFFLPGLIYILYLNLSDPVYQTPNRVWLFIEGIGVVGLIFLISAIKDTRKYLSIKKEYGKRTKEYDIALSEYQAESKKYAIAVQHEMRSYNEGMQQILTKAKDRRGDLTADIQSTKAQLQKAYSLNIIPLQFRNIQGIYYLYDYISTSNQGLSEALMQCNLDAIKQKLDNVIRLQGAAIVQQAQANAQLYQQNQQILATAQATMNNTAIAAKYAQISAINSKVSLKLQSKELAYQKADFWLK
ncbi:MAG: hypothetical protein LUG91_08145 [Ruminococcus sp.]|nr:hypothetical protein [Ruminococcus sp.]